MVQTGRIFADRREAGVELGKLLEDRYKDKNVLVLGIPRGGVVVAYEVANILRAELSVVITKKLPHPLHEEFAIGAVAEDGSIFLTDSTRKLDQATIRQILKAQSKEIKSRIQRFRKGKPLPELYQRIVIIVDDGIATGSTIVPAIELCKSRRPARIIVAAPVSGEEYVSEIQSLADEVVIVDQPGEFYAVGQAYDDFHPPGDEEVTFLLEDFERENK
jgi:putative phosphoribosyl transferase